MTSALRILVVGSSLFVLLATSAEAQTPRGGASDRERGILNRMGTRREERLNRNAPSPVNPQAAQQPGARQPGLQQPPGSRNPAAVGFGSSNQPAGNQPPGQVNRTGNTPGSVVAAGDSLQPYGTRYPAVDSAPRNQLPASNLSNALPPNQLPYTGPGVLIRLPDRLRGEVNYLVDDTEHLVVHTGEARHLRWKSNYEIRFSRGVTADGKSYGEARYTVSEGVYRFDVSDKGWELYREGEAKDVEVAIRAVQQRDSDVMQASALAPLKEEKAPSLPPAKEENTSTSEDTLPAPRSILER